MNEKQIEKPVDEIRPEYDLSKLKGRVRGKYAEPYREVENLVERADDRKTAALI